MLQQQTTEAHVPQFTSPGPALAHTPQKTDCEAQEQTFDDAISNEQTGKEQIGKEQIGKEQTGAEERSTASSSALNALIKQELRLKRRDDYMMLTWTAIFTFTMFAVTHRVTSEAGSGSGLDATTAMKYTLLLMVTMGVVTLGLMMRRSYRRKTALTQELSKNHDTALIGPLVDTLNVESTPVRNLSKCALIPLLPTLKASDADLLTDARRDRLLRLLAISPNNSGYRDLTELFSPSAYRREVDLRVSILKAFEQVGGAKELPAVERLARGLPSLPLGIAAAGRLPRRLRGLRVPEEIQQAADECLPYLQSRASGQRASEQLLRPSSAEATSGDVLLRPASSQNETLPEQMLRASETSAL